MTYTRKLDKLHGYIATDTGDFLMAIYGLGWTAQQAVQEARTESRSPDACFETYPATLRLMAAVMECGGGPGDVKWELVGVDSDSYADLVDEEEAS